VRSPEAGRNPARRWVAALSQTKGAGPGFVARLKSPLQGLNHLYHGKTCSTVHQTRETAMEQALSNGAAWEHFRHIFDDRGVRRDVAEARPYLSYRGGKAGAWVFADDGPFAIIPAAQRRATIAKDVNAKDNAGQPIDGLVMMKHPFAGDPYPPQLRPNSDPDVYLHDHDDYPPAVRARHEAGRKHDRRRVRVEGEHSHRHGKYKLAASPLWTARYFQAHPISVKGCRHRPRCQSDEEHTLKHVQKHHPKGDDTGGLVHAHERREKDPEADTYGQRLDIHPYTAARLAAGEKPVRWFFSLEGTLKNDALVSRGEFTLNVPSVTIWPAGAEFEAFREQARGVPVFVVPDSDWEGNPKVASQAWLCADALGKNATVAAPPPPAKSGCTNPKHLADDKHGLDDWLADGGRPEDLPVFRRELTPAFDAWRAEVLASRNGDIRARERLVELVGWFALHSDEQGRSIKPSAKAARYIGISLDRIEAMLETYQGEYDPDTWRPGIYGGHPAEWLDMVPFIYWVEELDPWERYGRGARQITVVEVHPDLRARTLDGGPVRLYGRTSSPP
jgi:hypothetical protein